jgi:hypothetical protein
VPTRLQFSTDVAAVGIWDRDAGGDASELEKLAQRGEACIVRLGGDCGGAVDVFVDEQLPDEVLSESVATPEERTVVVRSGAVVIDGIEHFPDSKSSCPIPNGLYVARIRLTKNDDELPEPDSEKQLQRALGPPEVDYYDRKNRNVLLIGLSTLLLLPALLFLVRWYVAVPVTLAVFVAYFHVQQRLLKRNRRYQNVAERITPLRLAGVRPILTVEFTPSSPPIRSTP